MGYCISCIDSKIFIAQKDVLSALGSLNENVLEPGWISNGTVAGNTDLHAGRWGFETDKNGNVVKIWFEGEKGRDDCELDPIAPYVKNGSFVEMMGEDGARWKWVFKNGGIIVKEGRVEYD